MNIRVQAKVEHRMVELKAKVDDFEVARRKLASLKAQHVGTFRQTDTYFDVPKGRLKLREVEGSDKAELVYYERENIAGSKRSVVFIIRIREPEFFKNLLRSLLKTKITVEKMREIYRHQATKIGSEYRYVQIHLDNVKKLGTFIELEMQSSEGTEEGDKQILENSMKELEIEEKQLEKYSYSDLLQRAASQDVRRKKS